MEAHTPTTQPAARAPARPSSLNSGMRAFDKYMNLVAVILPFVRVARREISDGGWAHRRGQDQQPHLRAGWWGRPPPSSFQSRAGGSGSARDSEEDGGGRPHRPALEGAAADPALGDAPPSTVRDLSPSKDPATGWTPLPLGVLLAGLALPLVPLVLLLRSLRVLPWTVEARTYPWGRRHPPIVSRTRFAAATRQRLRSSCSRPLSSGAAVAPNCLAACACSNRISPSAQGSVPEHWPVRARSA